MKKIFAISVFLILTGYIQACDVCSCSAGGNYFGILPQFKRHFVGMRYQYSHAVSMHPGLDGFNLGSEEFFRTYEAWGRYVVSRRIHLFAFVPVNQFSQMENEKEVTTKGLGDISVMANYILLNTGDSSTMKWRHALQIGGGIKLPTGKSTILSEGLLLHQNIQPGTGSFDIPVSLVYTLRYQQLGLNTELGYRFNTGNNIGFRYGNRFQTSCRLFYWQKAGKISFLPQAGLTFEKADVDYKNNEVLEYTGGSSLMANVGIDIYYNRFSLGAGFQKPVYQHMGDGNIQSKSRFNTQLIYLF